MATRTVEVVAVAASAPQVVWDLLVDVESWSEWTLYDEAHLERPGEGHPSGVGAQRRMKTDRATNLDEVFIFEPPRRLTFYVLETNLPVRNYRSDIQLKETRSGGTEIWWRSSFDAKIFGTGWMVHRNFKLFLGDTARRLVIRADTGAAPAED